MTAVSTVPVAIPTLEHIDTQVSALSVGQDASSQQILKLDDSAARIRAPGRLCLDGAPVIASGRFWKSLFRWAGINDKVLRLFTADEVFTRIEERQGGRRLRLTVERTADGDSRLLAAVPHRTAIISASRAIEILHAHGAEGLTYSDGIITSRHVPAANPGGFHVGPDKFAPRFSARIPLDGFGDPKLFVAMLRLACANGVIGMTRAFASTVRLGRSPAHALDRALGSYANADGFSAVRRRLEGAQSSWASVAEVMMLERVLSSISWGGGDAVGHRRAAFDRMTGDFGSMYGVASFTAISARQRTLLPTRARAYQLINFATEMATHHAPPAAATRLQAWFGSYISRDFDLEGTAQEDAEFDALLIPALRAPRRAHGNHGTRAARARRA